MMIPQLDKATAARALTPAARRMHRHVLTAFAATGRAPSREELERLASAGVLAELAEADVVAFDERGELRAAYPFSPHPTSITVTWPDGPTVYAMCAVDALGMSAMLDTPVIITATEPDGGAVVIVQVDRDWARWIPDTAVVLACATDQTCCPSVDRTCGYINFFTTARAARDWAQRHPQLDGAVLEQDTALAAGIAEFAAHLQGKP